MRPLPAGLLLLLTAGGLLGGCVDPAPTEQAELPPVAPAPVDAVGFALFGDQGDVYAHVTVVGPEPAGEDSRTADDRRTASGGVGCTATLVVEGTSDHSVPFLMGAVQDGMASPVQWSRTVQPYVAAPGVAGSAYAVGSGYSNSFMPRTLRLDVGSGPVTFVWAATGVGANGAQGVTFGPALHCDGSVTVLERALGTAAMFDEATMGGYGAGVAGAASLAVDGHVAVPGAPFGAAFAQSAGMEGTLVLTDGGGATEHGLVASQDVRLARLGLQGPLTLGIDAVGMEDAALRGSVLQGYLASYEIVAAFPGEAPAAQGTGAGSSDDAAGPVSEFTAASAWDQGQDVAWEVRVANEQPQTCSTSYRFAGTAPDAQHVVAHGWYSQEVAHLAGYEVRIAFAPGAEMPTVLTTPAYDMTSVQEVDLPAGIAHVVWAARGATVAEVGLVCPQPFHIEGLARSATVHMLGMKSTDTWADTVYAQAAAGSHEVRMEPGVALLRIASFQEGTPTCAGSIGVDSEDEDATWAATSDPVAPIRVAGRTTVSFQMAGNCHPFVLLLAPEPVAALP